MTAAEKHFSLASRSLKLDCADDVRPHISTLLESEASQFTSLDLSGNTIGVGASEYLGTVLPSLQSLETANLADIFTGRLLSEIPKALSALLEALLSLPNLHTIDLSDNAFGLNTVGPLVNFLSKHVPLQHLILQNNGLGPAAGSQVAEALVELAGKKEQAKKEKKKDSLLGSDSKSTPLQNDLHTIICGRNRLESGSMAAWARCFQKHDQLRTIKMVQNGIRQDGISLILRDGLGPGCKKLETLDLQDNTFTLRGAQALAGVVGSWTQLTELGIGDCLLSARGCVLLAETLAQGHNKQLRIIRAQYNDIDAKGVQALFHAADKALPNLQRIELNGNKFSEDEASVESLRTLLETRRSAANAHDRNAWGLDDLSDLEDDDSDDEEEEEDDTKDDEDDDADADADADAEDNKEARRNLAVRDAEQEETQNVAARHDPDVDNLAGSLSKTHIV